MKKVRLEKIDSHLHEELKNEEFGKAFEIERTKLTLARCDQSADKDFWKLIRKRRGQKTISIEETRNTLE